MTRNPATRRDSTRLDEFKGVRDGLLQSYRRLLALADSPEWQELESNRAILQEGRSTLEQEAFQVIVFGEFKHGKSTFLNALLGRDLCPMKVTPETAKISRIHHAPGRPESFRVVGDELPEEPRPLASAEDLHDFVGEGGRFTSKVREIDIFIDGTGTPLECGAVFVDTPGLRSVFADHDRVTEEYIKKADAVIFFFDGLRPFTADERNFLQGHPEVAHGAGTLYVLNRIDQISGGDSGVAEVEAHVRGQIAKLGIQLSAERNKFPQLFPISAKLALDHGPDGDGDRKAYQRSRFEQLRWFLGLALADNKGRILVDGAVKKQRAILGLADGVLSRAEKLLAKGEEERQSLEGRRQEWERKLDAARTAASQIVEGLREDFESLETFHEAKVDEFVDQLKGEVRAFVKKADSADDLEDALPDLISRKCRDWSQRHEQALQRRLQKVHEGVTEAMKRFQVELARDLASSLELETDGFSAEEFDDASNIPLPAGGGGVAGAGIGFAVGGPVGAAIGAALGLLLGGLLGWFLGSDWRDDAWEKIEESIDDKVAPRLQQGGAKFLSQTETTWKRLARTKLEAVMSSFEREAKELFQAARRKDGELKELRTSMAERRKQLEPVREQLLLADQFLVAATAEASAPSPQEQEADAGEEEEDTVEDGAEGGEFEEEEIDEGEDLEEEEPEEETGEARAPSRSDRRSATPRRTSPKPVAKGTRGKAGKKRPARRPVTKPKRRAVKK